MAATQRQPSDGLLHHSDRGSQYASHDYQQLLGAHRMEVSMSRKGDCYDNAVFESFWSTLKAECATRIYTSRLEARQSTFEYIEVWYNRQTRHSALGFLSPGAFESSLHSRNESTFSGLAHSYDYPLVAYLLLCRAISSRYSLQQARIPSRSRPSLEWPKKVCAGHANVLNPGEPQRARPLRRPPQVLP
jgi:hypothetical protein